MKCSILSVLFFLLCVSVSAQKTLVKKNGESINCYNKKEKGDAVRCYLKRVPIATSGYVYKDSVSIPYSEISYYANGDKKGSILYPINYVRKNGKEVYTLLPASHLSDLKVLQEEVCNYFYSQSGGYTTCTYFTYVSRIDELNGKCVGSTGIKFKNARDRYELALQEFLPDINVKSELGGGAFYSTMSSLLSQHAIDTLLHFDNNENGEVVFYNKNKKGKAPVSFKVNDIPYKVGSRESLVIKISDKYSTLVEFDNDQGSSFFIEGASSFKKYYMIKDFTSTTGSSYTTVESKKRTKAVKTISKFK